MKKFILVLFIFLIQFGEVFSQVDPQIQLYRNDLKGNHTEKIIGILQGNLIRTIFYNDGQIGTISSSPSLEWPRISQHDYLAGYTFLVSAEVITTNNQIIHPVEIAYREEIDYDPVTGQLWAFEPVPGYYNPKINKIATNTDSLSWPLTWPAALSLDSTWDGQWNGYFGKNNFFPSEETFFVLDDSKDAEWTGEPFNYFPILSDSTRGGLGLRAEVRTFQWDSTFVEDALFIQYDVTNISDFDYPKTYFGILSNIGIGGINDEGDDCISFDSLYNFAKGYDHDGFAQPGSWKTGYVGYAFLDTPNKLQSENKIGITSLAVDRTSNKSSSGIWPKNDEVLWQKLSSNTKNINYTNGNLITVMGSGPFQFNKWQKQKFTTALILGDDKDDLIQNKINVQSFFDSNYVFPDTINVGIIDNNFSQKPEDFKLEQNYPNPFNPTTTLTYSVAKTSNTKIVVYDILGNEIKTLVNEVKSPGKYSVNFAGANLSSGTYFYKIITDNFIQTKKMILLK